MPSRRNGTDPSDEPPNEFSPANSTTTNESFYSISPELAHANGERGVGKPWSRVDAVLQKEFAREKKAGKLSFEKKVEMYGEKLEEKFKELEERLLTREEELLLKGRELQRLKAENYLLNCRVETISSPSKNAPRIFQTSPEHPNARIIISPPFGNPSPKSRAASAPGGDIFDPQPPSKARKAMAMAISAASDDNTRRSSRKRTVKTYDDSSSDIDSEDMVENKRRKVASASASAKRRVSEPVKDAGAMVSPGETRRRKSSSKLLESTESAPRTKKERKEDYKMSSAGKNANREKEARLDRKENEELYEALQKQVTIDLLKRRGIPTTEQEEMVMDICKKLGLEKNTDLSTRAVTSVRYWVAHKSWRLRDHFKFLGQRYKSQHRNEDWSNSLPPVSAVNPLTNQKEVERWLFQSLGMRLAQRRMMSNPDIRRALWIVFVAGLRYGIRAAYDGRVTSPVFQAAIEALDVFTKDFEYPVNETTGFRGKMKVIKDESEEEDQGDENDELPAWEFDWKDAEEVLKGVQED